MSVSRKWRIAKQLPKKRKQKQNILNNRGVADNTDTSKSALNHLICLVGLKRKNNQRTSSVSKGLSSSTTSREVLFRKNSFRPLKKASKKEWREVFLRGIRWLIFQQSFLTVLTMT